MDPISVAAGIVAFLQVASSILSFCYDLRAGLRNVPESLISIVREIREIRNIVEALQASLDERDKGDSARTQAGGGTYDVIRMALSTSLSELKIIETKIKASTLTGTQGSKCKAFSRAVEWKLRGREYCDLLERIDRCKSTLTLAIESQNLTILVNIEKFTIGIKSTALETNSTLQRLACAFESNASSSREQKVVDWLSPLKPWENHKAAMKPSASSTCDWLLHTTEFVEWVKGKTRLLWLIGPPGGGKTTLLAKSVDSLANDPVLAKEGAVYAFAYCDFRQPDSLSPENVLGALLGQILVHIGGFSPTLLQEYEKHTRPACYSGPSLNLLRDILIHVSLKQRVVLFIDALDELGHNDRQELQAILGSLATSPGQISVFVTSRNLVDTHELLHDTSIIRLEDHVGQIDLDIRDYMGRRLQGDRGFQWLSPQFRETLLELLSARSQGMFRWAECQLNIISQVRTVKEIRRTIASLPDGLDQTYRRILTNTSASDRSTLKNALMWLVFATEPLTLEELWEAVAVEQDTSRIDGEARLRSSRDILVLGNSLITITQGKYVKLAHLSVRDYLLSASILQDPGLSYFHLSQVGCDAQIAIYCLTYLMFNELGCGPSSSAATYLKRLECMPLLKYASRAWAYHVRRAKSSPQLDSLVLRLFQSRGNFMSWVQVINGDTNFKWDVYPRHATGLYYAASFGLCSVVELLLLPSGRPEDLNRPGSRFGGTPLHAAAIRGHVDVMKILLDHGANSSKGDFNRVTPLHSASAQGHIDVVQLLLQYEADTGARDSMDHKTPLEWAQMGGKDEVVALLGNRSSRKADEISHSTSASESCSSGSDTPSSSAASENVPIWRPTQSFFPDFYERRSGTTSSIVISFEIEGEITMLNPEPQHYPCIPSDQASLQPVW